LPTDARHPERTRGRFEAALDRLARDGVIAGWAYTAATQRALLRLSARQWLTQWLSAAVRLVPPALVRDGYAALARPQHSRGARRSAGVMPSRSRRHRVLSPGDGQS